VFFVFSINSLSNGTSFAFLNQSALPAAGPTAGLIKKNAAIECLQAGAES
jgi:hypothetical protein